MDACESWVKIALSRTGTVNKNLVFARAVCNNGLFSITYPHAKAKSLDTIINLKVCNDFKATAPKPSQQVCIWSDGFVMPALMLSTQVFEFGDGLLNHANARRRLGKRHLPGQTEGSAPGRCRDKVGILPVVLPTNQDPARTRLITPGSGRYFEKISPSLGILPFNLPVSFLPR